MADPDAALPDLIDFDCPRCGADVAERYYGPCGACRDGLAALGGQPEEGPAVERFEPVMHVVPNHVATKE